MKLKKLPALLTAAAMAASIVTAVPSSVSAFVGKGFAAAPPGKQTVLADLQMDKDGTDVPVSSLTLAQYKSQWVKFYNSDADDDIASWVEDDDTYVKFTLSAVGKVPIDNGDTDIQDMSWVWGEGQEWFKFLEAGGNNYRPVEGVTSAGGEVWASLSDFGPVDAYGGIGFNVTCGHPSSITIDTAQIVKVSTMSEVKPDKDIPLGSKTGGGKTTITEASWGGLAGNNWTTNFYGDIVTAQSDYYYTDTGRFMKEFAGVLFEVKASNAKTVKFGDLQLQPYAQFGAPSYTWVSGANTVGLNESGKAYYVYMDMAQIITGTDTPTTVGIQIFDQENFNTLGLDGSLDYTVSATLLVKEPQFAISSELEVTEDETADIKVTVSPAVLASNIEWDCEDETIATVKDGTVTGVKEGETVVSASLAALGFVDSYNSDGSLKSANAKKCAVTVVPGAYSITAVSDGNGTVDAPEKAKAGTKVNLTAVPDDGYEFDRWESDDVTITDDSFVMPAKDVTVTGYFKELPPDTYAIVVRSDGNGTARADKTSAQSGDIVTLTAVPDDGYEFDRWESYQVEVDEDGTFVMPGERVEITAYFKAVLYTITVTDDGNGTAYADMDEAAEGVTVTLTAEPDKGYKFSEWVSDDVTVTGNRFTMPASDVAVQAVFEKIPDEPVTPDDPVTPDEKVYTVTVTTDGNGTASADKSSAKAGETVTLTASANSGYTFSKWESADVSISGSSFVMPEKNVSVKAIFEKNAEPAPVKTAYPISTQGGVTASATLAYPGTLITVHTNVGYDADVYFGGVYKGKLSDGDSFTMPSSPVLLAAVTNETMAQMLRAYPNSYIFVYDSDMNHIKTNGSRRGINGTGKITVDLGPDYAGKTVTLYKGRKNTSVKLDTKTLDKNGRAVFTVDGGKNYTLIVE